MPLLAAKVVLPLVKRGAVCTDICRSAHKADMQDAVEETIEYMDEYYLGKDDWDALVELGVDDMKDDAILKKIPTAVKTSFTRQ